MDYNGCVNQIQQYLENCPLVILGAGASMPYGLPSMGELATEIGKYADDFDSDEFDAFFLNLSTMNLEEALDASELSRDSQNRIREIVWEHICKRDKEFFDQIISTRNSFPTCELLRKVIQPAQNTATIITTNYDRVAEYAADIIGATVVTGFEGSLIKSIELPSGRLSTQRLRARERTVFIWKVHGSLDWFLMQNGAPSAYPLSERIPLNHIPLIIPPGKDKYSATHNEPYRSIISKADEAFTKASSYLCVGYGFNDEHIQPKLLAEIAKGKPIVVLARQATNSCKQHLIDAGIKKYIIIEESPDGKTAVKGNGWDGVYDGQFWGLAEFMNIW